MVTRAIFNFPVGSENGAFNERVKESLKSGQYFTGDGYIDYKTTRGKLIIKNGLKLKAAGTEEAVEGARSTVEMSLR